MSKQPERRSWRLQPGETQAQHQMFLAWIAYGGTPKVLDSWIGSTSLSFADGRALAAELHWEARARDWFAEASGLDSGPQAQARHAGLSKKLGTLLAAPILQEIQRRIKDGTFLADLPDVDLISAAAKASTAIATLAKLERLSLGLSDSHHEVEATGQPIDLAKVLAEIWAGDAQKSEQVK